MNTVGKYVEVNVVTDADGERDLIVGYANGRATRATRGLYLEGTRVADLVFASTPDWDAFRTTPPVRVALHAGTNMLRIQTDAADAETVDLDFVDVYLTAPPTLPAFYQALDTTGLLAIEAEHFAVRRDAGGQTWREITYAPGYAGDGSVVAYPNLGVVSEPSTAPRLDYPLSFARTGTHYVWVRGHAFGQTDDDSVTVGLDGKPAGNVAFVAADEFAWANMESDAVVTVEVATPGDHTLNLWMKKDGVIIDRIVLAAEASYHPDGVGPDESPHSPPIAPPDGADDGGNDPGGCGCRSAGGGGGGASLVMVAFGVALFVRRRR